jgi:hypothetical protein
MSNKNNTIIIFFHKISDNIKLIDIIFIKNTNTFIYKKDTTLRDINKYIIRIKSELYIKIKQLKNERYIINLTT